MGAHMYVKQAPEDNYTEKGMISFHYLDSLRSSIKGASISRCQSLVSLEMYLFGQREAFKQFHGHSAPEHEQRQALANQRI